MRLLLIFVIIDELLANCTLAYLASWKMTRPKCCIPSVLVNNRIMTLRIYMSSFFKKEKEREAKWFLSHPILFCRKSKSRVNFARISEARSPRKKKKLKQSPENNIFGSSFVMVHWWNVRLGSHSRNKFASSKIDSSRTENRKSSAVTFSREKRGPLDRAGTSLAL